jgi:hypothetical protein
MMPNDESKQERGMWEKLVRPVITICAIAVILAEFRAEVHGEDTVVGCYIRGFDGIEDGRCGRSR